MNFAELTSDLESEIQQWEQLLLNLDEAVISVPRNFQNRSIRQILGHMVDSASNNTHRVIHLQYRESPLEFPNYATYGNNECWIAIQNYQNEDWPALLQLWKYVHIHFLHVVKNIDQSKLKNQWQADDHERVTLEGMVLDFPRHFYLHLSEITELLNTTK